jgi:hypothetical protein
VVSEAVNRGRTPAKVASSCSVASSAARGGALGRHEVRARRVDLAQPERGAGQRKVYFELVPRRDVDRPGEQCRGLAGVGVGAVDASALGLNQRGDRQDKRAGLQAREPMARDLRARTAGQSSGLLGVVLVQRQ